MIPAFYQTAQQMLLRKIQISNYKSLDSLEIELPRDLSVFIGINNSGKSAILEAIGNLMTSNPHKSDVGTNHQSVTWVEYTIDFKFNELDFINGRRYQVKGKGIIDSALGQINSKMYQNKEIQISFQKNYYLEESKGEVTKFFGERFYIFDTAQNIIRKPNEGSIQLLFENGSFRDNGNLGSAYQLSNIVSNAIQSKIYYVTPGRSPKSSCSIGESWDLSNDFSNLPEVLSNLSSNFGLYNQFCNTLNFVLPNIRRFTMKNLPDNSIEVLIWETDIKDTRLDQAIPLKDAGSGIGQILGLLYIITVRKTPLIIVIDEIGNFLHPAAIKRFMQIIYQYNQHQYIISTHSSEVINRDDKKIVYFVSKEQGKTKIDQLNTEDFIQMQNLLNSIGSSISELYGSNNILWVEGITEEKAFKLILRAFNNLKPIDSSIVGVVNTGDFESSDDIAKRVIQIYTKLSTSNSFLPKTIGFIFDRELRSDQSMSDLKKLSDNTVYFLPRRLYENYLIHPLHIASIIFNTLKDNVDMTDPDLILIEVNHFLKQEHHNKKYIKNYIPNVKFIKDPLWLSEVDGAKLLKDLFAKVSENRVEYRKSLHSIQLTELIMTDSKDSFREVADMLNSILTSVTIDGR